MKTTAFLLFVCLTPRHFYNASVPAGGDLQRHHAPGGAITRGDLSWIACHWEGGSGQTRFEDHWIAPGKVMLRVGSTLGGDRAFFESLRVDERRDGIYYIAHPNGRAGTEFRLARLESADATFENPGHDYPRIIRYRKIPGSGLLVMLEGVEDGKPRVEEFPCQPANRSAR